MTGDEALGRYLNDHLAGSVAGHDLAAQICAENTGTPLGELMTVLVAEIEEDQATLAEIMERLGIDKSRLKQAAGWVGEKLSRVTLSDTVTGSKALSRLMQLEALSLGIEGKLSLWRSLQGAADSGARSGSLGEMASGGGPLDLEALVRRAQDQREKLETHRLEAAVAAFGCDPDPSLA